MEDNDYKVLAVLGDSPRALFREPADIHSLLAMALYIDRPVSDVYEMPDGSYIGKITESGSRLLLAKYRAKSAEAKRT